MGRDQQQVRIVPEGGLRSVPVMHIEIHNSNTMHLVHSPGMLGGNRCIAEQAEPHGLTWFGMMARWPHGAEGIPSFAGHDRIHGSASRARASECSLSRIRRKHGISIQGRQSLVGNGTHDTVNISFRMNPGNLLPTGPWRLTPFKSMKLIPIQRLQDGTQAFWVFRVSAPRIVAQASFMGIQECAHRNAVLKLGFILYMGVIMACRALPSNDLTATNR